MKCQGCQERSGCLLAHTDADGRRWTLCPDCDTRARAEKKQTLEDRARAAEALAREASGQMRLPGTGDAHKAKGPPLTLF